MSDRFSFRGLLFDNAPKQFTSQLTRPERELIRWFVNYTYDVHLHIHQSVLFVTREDNGRDPLLVKIMNTLLQQKT